VSGPRAAPLEVLYCDEHLVAVAKPSGLLVHRTAIDAHATDFAVQRLRAQLGQPVYPAHRLDKATSGVLLFALSPGMHRLLAAAFEARSVRKRYLGVVRGWPAEAGTIEHALAELADPHALPAGAPRPACSRFRRLAVTELPVRVDRYPGSRYALLELEPLTGRRHQLRRHLRHIGHPLIGDTTYGQGRHNRLFRERFDCHRLLLAAVEIALTHPASGAALSIVAPLAPDFGAVVAGLGWESAVPPCWRARPAPLAASGIGVPCDPWGRR
jgi:tRNA pseudouridine65 synthase